jgi:hypothetical protein
MKIKILLIGLLVSGTAIANCPRYETVTYNCASFQGNIQCSWNPDKGYYQGSANHSDYPVPPGAQAARFLRAFWTPNAHVSSNKLSYGVTICQYTYHGQIIVLYQKDRNPNIADPRRKNRDLWFLSDWQDAKGYSCTASERTCDFDYGEKF